MSFLSDAADGIGPAKIVRLDPGRSAEIRELENLVWAMKYQPDRTELSLSSLDYSRAIGVEVSGGGLPGGKELVAMASAWGFDTPVPGGRVKAAGLTWVGVRPEYQGRGYLRALIARHFADCQERSEPVSMLFASQSAIYGRFGYGLGSVGLTLRLEPGAALRPLPAVPTDPPVELRLETASFEAHGAIMETVDHRAGYGPGRRAGWTAPQTEARRRLLFTDEPPNDPTLEPWRILVASRSGEPSGYALFRRNPKWDGEVPAGIASVRLIQALDPASTTA